MESVLYVCDLLSGMTRKGNIQISIQHKRFVINWKTRSNRPSKDGSN